MCIGVVQELNKAYTKFRELMNRQGQMVDDDVV